jgi:MtN3 and saliva related transmembrane protein
MDALGYVAAVFATGSFVPQVIKTWRTRSAEDLSLIMLLLHVLGMTLWLIYGLAIGSAPIVVANAVAILLDVVLLALKIRAPSEPLSSRRDFAERAELAPRSSSQAEAGQERHPQPRLGRDEGDVERHVHQP